MKTATFFLALLAGCATPIPNPPHRPAGELAGRAAGAPQDCVPVERTEGLRVSDTDRHVLLYGRGSTIWASNLGPGCGFSHSDVLITRNFGGRYCRGDIVRSTDGMTSIPGPSCLLGEFVPYTR